MQSKIFARKVHTGNGVLENQTILIENGIIKGLENSATSPTNIPSVDHISAGFLDIHVNGGERFNFTAKPDEECLADMERGAANSGTAYVLPTMICSPLDHIIRGTEAIRSYRSKNPFTGIVGMHLEGPFLNPKKRGAHLTKYIQKPNQQRVKELLSIANGSIVQMTVAPEIFEDYDDLQLLLDSGIAITAGHSNATYEQAMRAFDKGIRQVTHFYNAMSSFAHRAPGLVGATFNRPDVYAPIVLDGRHCTFAAAEIAHKIKGDKLFLTTDALFLGRKKTEFVWEEFNAKLVDDVYQRADGTLSGAAISMGDAVRNAVQVLGISIQEAVEMATLRPATALGLNHRIGRLQAGYPARFTVFDDKLEHFSVLAP